MTFNDWFMPHCLYALAKLEKLTYLSLQGCNQFKDCIAYASITAITGFKCLQVNNILIYLCIILCIYMYVMVFITFLKLNHILIKYNIFIRIV